MAMENTSRDGRLDYDTAITQLIRANFSQRDASGRIIVQMTKEQVAAKRLDINEEEITQGYLWMMATLSPNRQQIQFAVVDTQQVNGSPVTPLSRLLTMQDSFLISNMSYFLTNYSYTGSSLQNPNFAIGNNWTPITYASTWANNGTGVDYDPGANMFWIGAYLQLQIQKRVIVPYLDCYRFFKAPRTQATPGFPVPSSYIPNQKNEHDGSSDGFNYVQPNIVIGGGRTNNLYLNLPANIPATINPFANAFYNAVPDGFVVMATVCMRGILMQNSTTVK